MRIVFVGGGTGGHFYPLIAIAEAVLAHAKNNQELVPELYYMGPEPYDEGSLFSSSLTYVYCPAGKRRRYASFQNFIDVFKTAWGTALALGKLLHIYPDVVMSKGGYTSVPVVLAAWLLRIPIVIHESDASPGSANVLGGHFARYIAITYEEASLQFPQGKTALTGIPVRKELLLPAPTNAHDILGLTSAKPLIVILGGSQGAERVNDLIISMLRDLLPRFEIVHQAGPRNNTAVTQTARALVAEKDLLTDYHVYGFLNVQSMHAALSEAAVVISRAGSGSIYEIALHGKPSILIPIPEDVSQDQRKNAYAYARTGAGEVIEEKNLSPHLLVSEITRIMNSPDIQEKMHVAALAFGARDAAERIAEALIAIGRSHR